eukprot:Sdes_comp22494_c0_seq1m20941
MICMSQPTTPVDSTNSPCDIDHMTKRLKLESITTSTDEEVRGVDTLSPSPSKVLHIRSLSDDTKSSDITSALSAFGPISYIIMISQKKQALVELSTVETAQAIVERSLYHPIIINGKQVFVNFSFSQEINKAKFTTSPPSNKSCAFATNILLLTVLNPLYNISVDVINTVCSPYGQVVRIVIFRKNGTQVLVEFESVDDATAAMNGLQNTNIYDGCCTLKIQFSNTGKLNVKRNTADTWDYTRLAASDDETTDSPDTSYSSISSLTSYQSSNRQAPVVVMIYGLNLKVNCNHIFNLVCLYGNIEKIKLLAKPGSAMIQFQNRMAADIALSYLQNVFVFGSVLKFQYSRHPEIIGSSKANVISNDNSSLLVDYSKSLLNRFLKPDINAKNRLFAPSSVLHFFNCPLDISKEQLVSIFVENGADSPVGVKLFDKLGSTTRSGLLEWGSVSKAAEALMLCNHVCIHSANKRVHVIRLAFSNAKTLKQDLN